MFPTIAKGLMISVPHFTDHLQHSLGTLGNAKEEAENIRSKALEVQFQRLIKGPLDSLESTSSPDISKIPTRIIIIDALDECRNDEHVGLICELLSQLQGLRTIRLRLFITSRHLREIETSLGKEISEQKALMDFSEETIEDIHAFLSARFSVIKMKCGITEDPWPSHSDFDRLVHAATQPRPLFIYAATLCRFVEDRRNTPIAQLKRWLRQSDHNSPSQLSQTYIPILQQLLFVEESGTSTPIDNEAKRNLRLILQGIVFLNVPLPAAALAQLLDVDSDDVNFWLLRLHAVLNSHRRPEDPVEVLHKSLADFLTASTELNGTIFQLDPTEAHAMLASRCIEQMKSQFRRDMCNLQDYGKQRDDIAETTISQAISIDLKYACLNWVFHLKECSRNLTNGCRIIHHLSEADIYDFLKEHFLHWLESLSLMGNMTECLAMIEVLRASLNTSITHSASRELICLLDDAKRYILSHTGIITSTPLQIYGGALLFSPQKSIIRKLFRDQVDWVKIVSEVEEDWGPHLQTLEGHGDEVRTLDLSFDGKVLISADFSTIRVWDISTGQQKHEFHFREGVDCLALSREGAKLASWSYDNSLRIWDLRAGKLEHEIMDVGHFVHTLEFSPNGRFLVAGPSRRQVTNGYIRVWNVATGEIERYLKGHSDIVLSLAFSPDGRKMASGSMDHTVRLWDTTTWQTERILKHHESGGSPMILSFDGETLLSSPFGGTQILVWDITADQPKHSLEGHNDAIRSAICSSDGETLVSWSSSTIRVFNFITRHTKHVIQGTSWRVAIFSADGKRMASLSEGNTIHIWETRTWTVERMFESHEEKYIFALELSASGDKLIFGYDKTIRIWDITAPAKKTDDNDTYQETVNPPKIQIVSSQAVYNEVRFYYAFCYLPFHSNWSALTI